MKFTRTINTFEAKAFELVKAEDGRFDQEVIATVKFVGTTPNMTDARKAFAANKTPVKKGTRIEIKKVSETLYACELEQFIAIATPIATKATPIESK